MVTTHKNAKSTRRDTLWPFVTILNNAFEMELAQEDEGYESGSISFNIPTPLTGAPRVYHVSTMEELSFNPASFGQSPTTPEHHEQHLP